MVDPLITKGDSSYPIASNSGFGFAELAEQAVGICHVPVFSDQPVLDTEHIDNIKVELVARWLDSKPFTTCVRCYGSAVNKYKVSIGDDLLDCVVEVGHRRKGRLKT